MSNWNVSDLNAWDERITAIADEMGLDYYSQEFEVCDHNDMLGYQSYVGMPSRYPHWSFGKSYEQQKTMYKVGLQGLSYEMVINSNPCLAYLMIDNPLSMQILVMAHVYGHNDFFKNNKHFSHTRAELALEMFKRHADRVRDYMESPGIGPEKVERILDAAHAIRFQCNKNFQIESMSVDDQRSRFYDNVNQEPDPWAHLGPKRQEEKIVFEPATEKDLLLFIRDNQRYLADWEKDLLTIVHEETQYFMPQMETKIMNEGWATFWHYNILNRLDLPPDMHMDFLRSHAQVVRPHVGGLNPYHVGYIMFSHLAGSDGHQVNFDIDQEIFNIRQLDRDSSFLRRYLTKELAQELYLFEYKRTAKSAVVSEVADEQGWEKIRETLISGVGVNGIPRIEAKEVTASNALILVHVYDHRELEKEYAKRTMKHIYELWDHPVELQTVLDDKPATYLYDSSGFTEM